MKITFNVLEYKINEFMDYNYPKEPNFVIINDIDFDYLVYEIELKSGLLLNKKSGARFFMGVRVIVTKDVNQGELILN